jgi:hypothetical protein
MNSIPVAGAKSLVCIVLKAQSLEFFVTTEWVLRVFRFVRG